MKKLFSLLFITIGLSVSAQNADPYLSILTSSPSVPLNSTTTLQLYAGNVGNGTIVSNSLRLVVSVGNNAEIIGLIPGVSDPRWTQQSLSSGAGNVITLVNTGTTPFSSFDISEVYLTIKGVVEGGPATISGFINYLPGTNPLLGGAANNTQGNAVTTNDNSTTSLLVSPESCNQATFRTTSSGNWSNLYIWSCLQQPGVNDSVIVSSGHSLVLDEPAQIRKLRIEPGATVTLSDQSVTFIIGSNANKISPVLVDGTLTITNGIIRINGNLTLSATSDFNLTGGSLIIDGNTGAAGTSIPDGQHLFNVASTAGNFDFTGGKLQFISPPYGANSQTINSPHNFSPLSLTVFGDGVTLAPSLNPNGFGGTLMPAQIGKFHLDAATLGNNRVFRVVSPLTIRNELKVFSGNLIQAAPLTVN